MSRSRISVFQVLPRRMYFGPARASSIDLCVHELVQASRSRDETLIFAEEIDCPFQGHKIEFLPSSTYATTLKRANCVAKAARRYKPQIIVVQQHLPTAAALARRLPGSHVVLHTHNFQKTYPNRSSLSDSFHRSAKRRRYEQLAGIIHVSETCKAHFEDAWSDLDLPGRTISNGLNFSAWSPAAERTREIALVARCVPDKGVLEAAQAVAGFLPCHPDWRARFILSDVDESDPYFQQVQVALKRAGDRASLLVQRPFSEVKQLFERVAIALIPSKWTEPFGRVALEAHAGGAAVISSRTGGLAEVSGGAALEIAVQPQTILDALERLVSNEPLREHLASEGAKRVRRIYPIEIQADRFDGFCQEIIDPRSDKFDIGTAQGQHISIAACGD